ncbi:MerR family transcriptional regulator, partial [Aduncisulcus paluster]
VAPFALREHAGGLYAMAVSIDEDNESLSRVEDKVRQWVDNTNFQMDDNRNVMFNMPYLYEEGKDTIYQDIEKGLGYKQMQRYFPIKLKAGL